MRQPLLWDRAVFHAGLDRQVACAPNMQPLGRVCSAAAYGVDPRVLSAVKSGCQRWIRSAQGASSSRMLQTAAVAVFVGTLILTV